MNKKVKRLTKNQEAEAEIKRLTEMNAQYLKRNLELVQDNNKIRMEREDFEDRAKSFERGLDEMHGISERLRKDLLESRHATQAMAIFIAGDAKRFQNPNTELMPRRSPLDILAKR